MIISPAIRKPDFYCGLVATGTINATREELLKQMLLTLNPGDQVLIRKDPDERYYQISRTGRYWFYILASQIQFSE